MGTVWIVLWVLAALYTVGNLLYILTWERLEGKGMLPRTALPSWILWVIGATLAFVRHMNPLHLIWIWMVSGFIAVNYLRLKWRPAFRAISGRERASPSGA